MNNYTASKINSWKSSATLKIFFIGFLLLLMLIPVEMIKSLNQERMNYQDSVTREISHNFGGSQNIVGPILSIPYKHHIKGKNYQGQEYVVRTEVHYAHFLPKTLLIDAENNTKMRYRSIYEIPIYETKTKISGTFSDINFKEWKIPTKDIIWEDTKIFLTITNPTAISDKVHINWNDKNYEFKPATNLKTYFGQGLQTSINGGNLSEIKEEIPFSLDLNFSGSETLTFSPLGEENKIKLSSNWIHPSFIGKQLPQHRKISKSGFTSEWKSLHFGRTYPQRWIGHHLDKHELFSSSFGVNFFIPVDVYQLTERSIKYACLFIILTFISFFLFEILSKLRVHPIQYIMIGISLCLFYILLLSLAEHIGFTISYIIAGIATLIMITSFSISILKDKKRGSIIGGIIFALYTYLFVILQLESYSLLMGSVGLFFIMGSIMWVTRKVDWYDFGQQITQKVHIKKENDI